jgi:hypothetical protein
VLWRFHPQVLEQLAEMVPVMQRHMAEIAAEAPMPAEAIPAAQVTVAPMRMSDLELLHACSMLT